MITFSTTLASKGLPTKITSAGDIELLLSAFHEELKALNFWQYYVLDVTREKASVKAAFASAPAWQDPPVAGKTVAELAEIIRSSGKLDESKKFHKRFGVTVDTKVAASLIKAAFTELDNEDALADAWVRVADVLNVPLYKEWEEDTRVALDSIKNRVKYTRLDEHGPKMGEITKTCVRLSTLHCFSAYAHVVFLSWRLISHVLRRPSMTPKHASSRTTGGSGTRTLFQTLRCHPRKRTCAVKSSCGATA